MSKNTETAIKNIVYILILELLLLPFGIFVYLNAGWHLYHVFLGFAYLYGIVLIIDTANILLRHIRIINDLKAEESEKDTILS